jgi:hypothetical protein
MLIPTSVQQPGKIIQTRLVSRVTEILRVKILTTFGIGLRNFWSIQIQTMEGKTYRNMITETRLEDFSECRCIFSVRENNRVASQLVLPVHKGWNLHQKDFSMRTHLKFNCVSVQVLVQQHQYFKTYLVKTYYNIYTKLTAIYTGWQ